MPTVPRPLSSSLAAPLAVALAGVLATTGCAGLTTSGASQAGTFGHVDIDAPPMRQFAVANMTDMERDVRLETGTRKDEKLTPALFWSGITVGTIGAVGAIAFGVAGFVTKTQLNDGYYGSEGLTLAEQERLVSNGDLYNTLSISFTAIAAISYALAIVTYGVDWNRCGPLAPKRRHCKAAGYRTESAESSD